MSEQKGQALKLGLNYPWCDYGWDIGLAPSKSGKCRRPWEARLGEELEHLKALGVFALRWFLLCDGAALGPEEGILALDENKYRLELSERQTLAFCEDFEKMLRIFEERGILLMPVLLDHLLVYGQKSGGEGIVKQGRAMLIRDEGNRKRFREQFLRPMLEVAARCKESVYAVDIINEPELCEHGSSQRHGNTSDIRLNAQEISAFVRECAGDIKDIGLRATLGFQYKASLDAGSAWGACAQGLDLLQYHYYGALGGALDHEIPAYDSLGYAKECVIGEIATGRALGDAWPVGDGTRADGVLERLLFIERQGYPAVFLWSMHAEEGREGRSFWGAETEEELLKFKKLAPGRRA